MTPAGLPRPVEWDRYTEYAIEGGVISPTNLIDRTRFRLPIEVVPQVVGLNLESEAAIMDFVAEFGPLGVWHDDFRALDLRDMPIDSESRITPLRARRAKLGSLRFGETLHELRIGASAIQSLVALIRELDRGDRYAQRRVAKDWPARFSPWVPQSKKGLAWWHLVSALNAGIAVSEASLAVVEGRDLRLPLLDHLSKPGLRFALALRAPTSLYGVCIVELVNHLLEGRSYRVCASATCDRVFSIQEGRSRYGGHRSDSKYHDTLCANAEAQRKHRAKQRERRGK
jgi:hypothetical protein